MSEEFADPLMHFTPSDLFLVLGTTLVILLVGMYWPVIKTWPRQIFLYYVEVRRPDDDDDDVVAVQKTPATTDCATVATSATMIATPQNDRNPLLLHAKVAALAQLIHANKVTQTEGIKLVFGVSPSSTNTLYLTVRDMLKTELARLQPVATGTTAIYPPLTEEQQAARIELGLDDPG